MPLEKKDNSKTLEELQKLYEEFPEVWENIVRKRVKKQPSKKKKGGKRVPAKDRSKMDEGT